MIIMEKDVYVMYQYILHESLSNEFLSLLTCEKHHFFFLECSFEKG